MESLIRLALILGIFISGGSIEQREYTIIPTPTPFTEEVFTYPYPEYISVRITGKKTCEEGMEFTVVEIPFKDYVKGVLANEWGHDWDEESIKAGAVAVKMYAWNAVLNGGKWGGYEYGVVYDCDWDMVYNPYITRDSTDKAVDATWDYILVEDNTPKKKVHFLAWYGACINWVGDSGDCIGQWNSKEDAEEGMKFDEILEKYFYNSKVINLKQEDSNAGK